MSELIESLSAALRANPNALPLRLHLAGLLLDDGQRDRAIAELGTVLGHEPSNETAQALLRRALGVADAPTPAAPPAAAGSAPDADSSSDPRANDPAAPAAAESSPAPATEAEASEPAPDSPADPGADSARSADAASGTDASGVDWASLERDLGIKVDPPFVSDGSGALDDPSDEAEPSDDETEESAEQLAYLSETDDTKFFEEPQPERIKLADVGGLDDVKERLRISFLEPMRNPEVAKAYGKSLRGGLLLYGPPGTGKTYLARAIAGELDAKFLSITIADILGGVIGESEKNVRRVFDRARDLAPCVLFIDELDSLGGKRAGYSNMGWMRNVVNQILQEMDGVGAENDGVYILAATNHPWDVDNALLRPGRFDRILLVTAPDPAARAAILKYALKDRPIAGIDLDELVRETHGFSGADLTHLAASAAEFAMSDSLSSGQLRPIEMNDMRKALTEVKPSTGPWLQSARNVVDFANADGRYDDLKNYLEAEQKYRQHKKQKK